MLSKEEIKHILDVNVDILTYKADKDFRCLTSTEKALLENNEKIKEYIEYLESREQKLIEKLEEDKIELIEELKYNITKREARMQLNLVNKYLEIVKGE